MLGQTLNVAAMVASYTNTVCFNSRHCILLAHQLERVAPTKLDKAQRDALDLVKVRAQEVEEVRKARQRVAPRVVRSSRLAVVTAWGAVHGALTALSSFPKEVSPIGAEATALLGAVFADGTPGMSALDAGAVWAEAHRLFARTDEQKLREKIDAMIAPALLQSCEYAFAQLGDAVGVSGERQPEGPKTTLREASARFSFAVSSYARALSVGLDETDEVTLARFQSALAPIDVVRPRYSTIGERRRAGGALRGPGRALRARERRSDRQPVRDGDLTARRRSAPARGADVARRRATDRFRCLEGPAPHGNA